MKKDVLGVKIDDVSLDQAVEIVKGWLDRPGQHQIVTPNPEIVVMAQKDPSLKNILNNADLAVPDGVGLKLFTDIVCHTPGVDLMEALIKLSTEKGFTVGFLGGREGVANKTSECLSRKYPKLKVVFARSEGEVLPTTDLLFVAFGPPKQEKWIANNLPKLPVKVAMGVGGAFDYLSHLIPRAPKSVRTIGFEWLFRLIIQPWRLTRQLALIKYIWLILTRPKI